MPEITITEQRLNEIISGFSSARIAVVGDYFLDKYLDVDPTLEQLSVETELPAHQVSAVRCFPGAAGTVVSNLAALGAGELIAIGFTGNDGESFELRRALKQRNCSTDHLHEAPNRLTPTYLKPRDQTRPGLDGEHSRYDTRNRIPLPTSVEDAILTSLKTIIHHVDGVIILDQVDDRNCGVVTDRIRKRLSELAIQNPNVVFWVDSRRRVHEFVGITTKPNQFETIGRFDPAPDDVVDRQQLKSAAMELHRRTDSPVFVTMGGDGIAVVDDEWTQVPTLTPDAEIDSTGAGDSTSAGCVLALCAGASRIEAAIVGNLVASLTILQLASTGTASSSELPSRLGQWLCKNADDV